MHWPAILSFFRETKTWNCSYRVRHLRTVLKPFRGLAVVFVVLSSSLILLNPFQNNFSVYQKALYGKTKNLLKTGFVIRQNTWKLCGTEPLLMVYNVEWVYLLLCQRPILKPEVMMFISRAHVSWVLSESSNAVNTCSWNYHRILAH